jgi:hypothetical protein
MKKNNFLISAIFCFLLSIVFFDNSSAQEAVKNELVENDDKNFEINIENPDNNRLSTAVIQGLNKITAKSNLIEIKIGNSAEFGKLKIKVYKCWKAPLDQKPENKMLIEVLDSSNLEEEIIGSKKNNKSEYKRIFLGWIFSSSPSISGIEHPIYDIAAINCK